MAQQTNKIIAKYISSVEKEFDQIPEERKAELQVLADYVIKKKEANKQVNLTFICTHNSRRSHMAQIWAQTAAAYYNISDIHCYSGGTEATAFNPRAVKAIEKAGFEVEKTEDGENPVYFVTYSEDAYPMKCFSKVYDDEYNPKGDFAAIMTCSHADANCPYIPGAEQRISLTYEDPKEYDGTDLEAAKYDERCREIAREMLYVFSKI